MFLFTSSGSHPYESPSLTLPFVQMQWPVYSLAEAGAEIIRAHYNGLPDPFAPINSNGNNNNNNNAGGNGNTTNSQHGGAISSSSPSLLTSALAFLFAVLAVVL